jgi:shikimate kinase
MTDTFRTSKTVSALDPSKPHVILVGLAGSGKSTVGAMVAERLGRTFLDFDVEIERREGMPISRIFAERGEAEFRRLERKLTEEVRELGNMVLAPGGGWIMDQEGVGLLRPPAVLVYLRVRPETAIKRLAGSIAARPLLNRPDPVAEMQRMFEERRQLYQGAAIEIGAELISAQQVTEQIVERLASVSPPG